MHVGAGMLGKDRQLHQGQTVAMSVVDHLLDGMAGILSLYFPLVLQQVT